jgi:hypothetical protein
MSTLNWAEILSSAGDISTQEYEPLPDGEYEFVVLEGVAKQTSTGKTMFVIKAQVESGPHAKRLVWDNLVVSLGNEKALGIFFAKMGAMGLTREFFDREPTNAQIEQALVGRRFRGRVGNETYNGKTKNVLTRYASAQAQAIPGMPQSQASPPVSAPPPVASPPPASGFAPTPSPAPAPAPTSAPGVPF